MSSQSIIRKGSHKDLEALLCLEEKGFERDRFSRGQFRYLLNRANASTYVVHENGHIRGAAIMLWRRSSPTCRLYSIVIDPAHHGKGMGAKLMEACEKEALKRECGRIVLEVRADNKAAINLYEKFGYKIQKTLRGYYSDGVNGLQMSKPIGISDKPEILLDIPYFPQTLDFTCGSACVMMAMKYFRPKLELTRAMELTMWKESTTIFMSAGFGGCGPVGLAVAAARRGYKCRVIMGKRQTPFISSVRSKEKKEVVRIVHETLREEAKALGIIEEYYNFTYADIAEALRRGTVPIVLVSTYRLHQDRSPHWVVVTGFDRHNIYYHDPYKNFYEHGSKEAQNIRIPVAEFHLVRRYGKDVNRNVIIIEGIKKPSRHSSAAG